MKDHVDGGSEQDRCEKDERRLDDVWGFSLGIVVCCGPSGVTNGLTLRNLSVRRSINRVGILTRAPMTNGIQNHVRFLTSRKVWMPNRTPITRAPMTPAAIVGVYGHSTYSGFDSPDMLAKMIV